MPLILDGSRDGTSLELYTMDKKYEQGLDFARYGERRDTAPVTRYQVEGEER